MTTLKFSLSGKLTMLLILHCTRLLIVDECPVLDTVPVSETLSQLACQSYNNMKDFHVRAMTKEDLPKRYHYSNSHRIEDIVLAVDEQYITVKYVNCFSTMYTSSRSTTVPYR